MVGWFGHKLCPRGVPFIVSDHNNEIPLFKKEITVETIISALIAGGLALVGVIITNLTSGKNIENKLVTAQAVTDTKIDALTNEVRRHNNFAEKIPVMEHDINQLKEDVKELRQA